MIIQTNTYICDECKEPLSESKEASVFDDPVIGVPVNWSYITRLLCPKCTASLNQEDEGYTDEVELA